MHKKNESKSKKKTWINRFLLIISILFLAGGVYLLVLVLTPNLTVLSPAEEINVKALAEPAEDRVYIPKIGVNVALASGGPEALDEGSWHRFPERGDPEQGGNFIISAHRFSLGATPNQTRTKSPFYHINKLEIGDQIIVDFNKKRYGYEITSQKQVKPSETSIEAPLESDDEPRMTLYTCTFKGESDGREVYFAKPLGEVVDGTVIEDF
jgi:sortase A